MFNRQVQIGILLFSQFLIIACLDMTDPYWPLILKHNFAITNSAALNYWSGAVYILPFLATIFTTPLWTQLGAKIGFKKMVLRACIALVITQVLVGFISSPFLILLIRLCQGIFAGFTAAAQAWMITLGEKNSHSKIIGHQQAATAIGTIVGPIMGGVIAHYLGYQNIFFISGGICALTTVTLGVLLQEQEPVLKRKQQAIITPTVAQPKFSLFSKNGHHSRDQSIPVGFQGAGEARAISSSGAYIQYVSSEVSTQQSQNLKGDGYIPFQVIFLPLLFICGTQTIRWISTPFFALYSTEQLAGNNLTVGFLYSCVAMAIFIAAPVWGHLLSKWQKSSSIPASFLKSDGYIQWVYFLNLILAACSQYLYATSHSILGALCASLLWGGALGAINTITFTLLIQKIEDKLKAILVGWGSSASKLGNLLGVALGAVIQAHFSFYLTFIFIALLYILMSFVVLYTILKQIISNNNNKLGSHLYKTMFFVKPGN